MFENKLKIQIPEPCSQLWNNMEEVINGRYCSQCNKNLIDFTNFSDKELIDFVQNNQSKVCGRFKKAQLEKFFFDKKIVFNFTKYKKIVAALLSFNLVNNDAGASNTIVLNSTFNIQEINYKKESNSKFNELPIIKDTTKILIKGIIQDYLTNEPLPFVIISIKKTTLGTESDEFGNFTLNIPYNLNQDSVTIITSYLGYMSNEMKINLNNSSKIINVKLHSQDFLLGEVIIIKNKWWQFWKWF